jgi:hypothetical protein
MLSPLLPACLREHAPHISLNRDEGMWGLHFRLDDIVHDCGKVM